MQALSGGETLADSFTAVSADGSTQVVNITITGTNDAPSIGGNTSGGVTEESSLTDTGTLTITDTDDGEDVFVAQSSQASTSGYGAVDIDASGNWTYTLDNANATVQALSASETLADSFTAVSADGSTQVVNITITGANDAPSIGGDTSGAVTEESNLTDTGTLTITDTDDGEDVFVAQSSQASTSGYGTVDMDTAGNWTYTLDNANPMVQAQSAGETLADSFTAVSADGSTQIVNISITGTNDAPTLANAIADQTAIKDVAFSFTFVANTFSDVDASDTLTYTALLADDSALPAWLSFDAATRTFSGKPTNADTGTVSVKVTADDGTSTRLR